MALLGNTYFDLVDLYRRQDGSKNIADIIELMTEMNPILDDALTVECNKGARHLTTIRTGLPDVAWGELYKGIVQSKSTTQQVEDVTGFIEGLSSIDKRLLELSDNESAVRLSEAQPFLEAMNNTMASAIFYESSDTNPKAFNGLATRFGSLSGQTGNQIIDAGGTGADNTSVWFVTWGDKQCHLLYPKGTTAGLAREDKGEQRVTDSDGNPYYVKEEEFRWNVGLSVRDHRYVSRVANIDASDLAAGTVDVYCFLRKAFYSLQNRRVSGGKLAMYCNSDVLEALDAAAVNAGSSDNFTRLKPVEIEGKEVLTYRGIPIRETDALLNTEARVV